MVIQKVKGQRHAEIYPDKINWLTNKTKFPETLSRGCKWPPTPGLALIRELVRHGRSCLLCHGAEQPVLPLWRNRGTAVGTRGGHYFSGARANFDVQVCVVFHGIWSLVVDGSVSQPKRPRHTTRCVYFEFNLYSCVSSLVYSSITSWLSVVVHGIWSLVDDSTRSLKDVQEAIEGTGGAMRVAVGVDRPVPNVLSGIISCNLCIY
jgi:hypothetical protein